MNDAMSALAIVGYASRMSIRPNDRIAFMVSTDADEYDARLVRLHGPGDDSTPEPSSIDGRYQGRRQALPLGSYIRFEQVVPRPSGWEISAWIRPTAPGDGGVQAIAGWGTTDGVFVDGDARLAVRANGEAAVIDRPLTRGAWYEVRGQFDPDVGEVVAECRRWQWPYGEERLSSTAPAGTTPADGQFCIAAAVADSGVIQFYDGKIEAPTVTDLEGRVVARWDFSLAPESTRILDRGPRGLNGTSVNHPQRAVTGHNWRGEYFDFRAAQDQYGAIAFHRDDLSDARWKPDFALESAGLSSGVYAVHVVCEQGEDHIPFFVCPPVGEATAPVALVLPTYSYVAYGNERHWWDTDVEAVVGKPLEDVLGPADRWAEESKMVSLYDHHADGTGNCFASYLRPLANIRPDYQHPLIRGPHQLSADMYVVKWLEEQGQPFDVLTDEELHHYGAAALRPYKAVMTGTHPEYPTGRMLDALSQYVAVGGGLMYLGGNGFYWVTSVHPEEPHVVEVRRGHAGSRPWESDAGEWHHSTTGEPGGLWRYRGRSPHILFGVGTAGFAFGKGRPYRRTREGQHPQLEWIFEGVDRTQAIGDFGDIMDGAAGFEFDRHDPGLGSPPESIVIATADDFDEFATGTVEETLVTGPSGFVRADLVYTDFPGAGSVFSVGSATWGTSLLHNNGANDVSRVTGNVLQRFLA